MNKDNYSYARFYPKIDSKYVALVYGDVILLEDKLSALPYGLNDQEDLYERHGKDLMVLALYARINHLKLTFEVEYEEHIYVEHSNIDIYELEDLIN